MGFITNLKLLKHCMMPSRYNFGSAGKNIQVGFPVYIASVNMVHMEDNTVLRGGVSIQNNKNEHVYIKKYTVISRNVTIVTNNHRSTVGIPQCLLGASHINDTSYDITIEEDVWVGTNATILAGGSLGRGCIVGACSTVTKPVPPYALVVGTPAKIVGVKFSIDDILEHERILYKEEERMTRNELELLFKKYYADKKVFGIKTLFGSDEYKRLDSAISKRQFIGADTYLRKLKDASLIV